MWDKLTLSAEKGLLSVSHLGEYWELGELLGNSGGVPSFAAVLNLDCNIKQNVVGWAEIFYL